MSQIAKNEWVNGYEVATYENSKGITYYLYQGYHPAHGKIWTWKTDKPNGGMTSYGINYYPCPMQAGYEVAEAVNTKQPVLKKL